MKTIGRFFVLVFAGLGFFIGFLWQGLVMGVEAGREIAEQVTERKS